MSPSIEDRARFDFIRYANCWEDADVLCQALEPRAGKRLLSIASGGDNSFALLAAGAEVVAADLSPAQLALVELKSMAIRRLDRSETLAFLGLADGEERLATYQRLRVDAPWSEVAVRATLALGRLRLRQARPAEAAARIQQALTAGSLEPALARRSAALLDLAVDTLLRRVATTESLRVSAGSRPSAIAATSSGGASNSSRIAFQMRLARSGVCTAPASSQAS